MSGPWEDYGGQDDAAPWQDYARAKPQPRKPTSQGLGVFKGVMKPIDNGAIALESGARAIGLPVDRINRAVGTPDARTIKTNREAAIAKSPYRPGRVGEVVGNVVGTLPTMAVTKNPFAAGALQGAALTDADNPIGVAADAAVGAGLNWAGGKVIDAASNALAPVIDPAVRRLSAAGVKLTPGMVKGGKAMIREDKAMSRPGVGPAITAARQETQATFNTAAVNRALAPLGEKVPAPIRPGHDAVDYAKTRISQAYDQVIPNLAVQMNGPAFVNALMPVARNLKPAQQKQLRQIISNELGAGSLAGQQLKSAQGNLRRLAGKFIRSQDANDQMLGEALRVADDELTAAMIQQNPQWAPQLQKVNEAYRGYRIVADAAGRADDGLMNTGQLKQAVRRGDWSKNKDANGRGVAFMQDLVKDARAVIPARAPNPSGTAAHMQAGNLFANLRGQGERLAFASEQWLTPLNLLPRPGPVKAAARAIQRAKRPASGAAVAVTHNSRD